MNLIKAGFTPDQAEALSEEQVKLIDSNLATKTDLAETKSSLIKWTMTVMGIYSAIIISVLGIIINTIR